MRWIYCARQLESFFEARKQVKTLYREGREEKPYNASGRKSKKGFCFIVPFA
jgi:hypothetical protein